MVGLRSISNRIWLSARHLQRQLTCVGERIENRDEHTPDGSRRRRKWHCVNWKSGTTVSTLETMPDILRSPSLTADYYPLFIPDKKTTSRLAPNGEASRLE